VCKQQSESRQVVLHLASKQVVNSVRDEMTMNEESSIASNVNVIQVWCVFVLNLSFEVVRVVPWTSYVMQQWIILIYVQ
jgi:hypothetical protein